MKVTMLKRRFGTNTFNLLTALLAIVFAGPRPVLLAAPAQMPASTARYETRAVHDPNGTGRFYMGREIAQVMGPGGIPWLDRPDRDAEQKPAEVIGAMQLTGKEVVADLGAGSGYFTFRLSPKAGKVLAVDIQDEMIATLRQRASEQKVTNVEVIKGSECDPHLPTGGVDVVLMVDVYHEVSCPYEMMTAVRQALKPAGRVVFVEYRLEDPHVQIKEVHKMSVAQLEKEMTAVKFRRLQTVETLPLQHIVIFGKTE
jgi:2-polyprenyl-3-methyl-5-hydroxy-6-metoxy-1,4-benzoquinol methylase